MAGDSKISNLTAAGSLTGAEIVPVVQSSSTVRTTLTVIATWFAQLAITLTNKRVEKRVSTTTSIAGITPNIDTYDAYYLTAMAGNLTVSVVTGTPTKAESLIFRFLDNGTPRTITWDASFVDCGATPPTTTTANKITYVFFVYDAPSTQWMCVNVKTQP